MRLAFVTVGDTSRLTGGYLYNARVVLGLEGEGVLVEEVVASGASPGEQEAAARRGAFLDPSAYDVVVVDALARIVCAPYVDSWREFCPVVAMVHELPGVAAPAESPADAQRERAHEAPLLGADLMVAVSEHGRAILEDRGAEAARVRVVPPGFDRLSPDASAPGAGARDGVVRALCVAQWIPRKGVLDLVRAWALRERPDAVLELVGEANADPGYSASVHAAVADASEASITVRGPVDDAALAAAYAGAELFALPSRYEGYGIVFAEALAYGLPVIGCDAGPVPELVGPEAAVLVTPGDIRALSEALDLLLGDADLRRRMSAAARRRAEGLPRWEDTVTGFADVLGEAVAGRRR